MAIEDSSSIYGTSDEELYIFLADKRNRLSSELSQARLQFADVPSFFQELEAFGEHTLEVWDDATEVLNLAVGELPEKPEQQKLLNNFVGNSENWLAALSEGSFFLDASRAVHGTDGIDFRQDLMISSWVDALGMLIETLYEYLAADKDEHSVELRYAFDWDAMAEDHTFQLRLLAALNEWSTGEVFTADRWRNRMRGRQDEGVSGGGLSSSFGESTQGVKGTKNSRGAAAFKLKAALTKHHGYENGSVGTTEPVGANALAKAAGVAAGSASAFFMNEFGGHRRYVAACSSPGEIAGKLKLLNGEVRPKDVDGIDVDQLADWQP